MKAGRVSGAKIPHKTRGDAAINTKPICHVTMSIYLRCVGKIMALSPGFRKLVFQGAPPHRQAPGASSQGGRGFLDFLLLFPLPTWLGPP